jgi:mannosylglycoprotein endo-beta-mannosidase
MRKRKNDLKQDLAELESKEEHDTLSLDEFVKKTKILVELQELYADEELFLVQRCSERWLLKGDHNSAYFHRVANGRRKKCLSDVKRWRSEYRRN